MYESIKKTLKTLAGRKRILKYESLFRKIIYLFYKGAKYQCTVCLKTLRCFIVLQNGEKLCPYCGSLPRNRRLISLLENEKLLTKKNRILEFSPSRCVYRKLKADKSIEYTTTDFSNEFIADKKLDITKIEEPTGSYDVVICYHILEHIDDDKKAMKELKRILKPGGKCFVQTPFQDDQLGIYENENIKNPSERLVHFGQRDHVRIYTVSGLQQRLTDSGFQVKVISYKGEADNYYGYSPVEYVLMASVQ